MSILLEALRKSEKSQRPTGAPTIHAEQHAAVDTGPLGKGPMTLLLVLALVLIAWVIWRQYQPPANGYRPPVTLQAKPGAALTTPVSSLPPTDAGRDSGQAVKGTANVPRTPVEVYQPPKGAAVESAASPSKLQPTPASGLKDKAAPGKTPANNGPAADRNLAPISYWELPDAVRAEVPEFSFSVLVYASKPADRFVLVNGERLQEGDSYQQGLVVEEIRRDGIVFSYRLYRFLVER